jgi:hypothetical protein
MQIDLGVDKLGKSLKQYLQDYKKAGVNIIAPGQPSHCDYYSNINTLQLLLCARRVSQCAFTARLCCNQMLYFTAVVRYYVLLVRNRATANIRNCYSD